MDNTPTSSSLQVKNPLDVPCVPWSTALKILKEGPESLYFLNDGPSKLRLELVVLIFLNSVCQKGLVRPLLNANVVMSQPQTISRFDFTRA